MTEKLQEQAQLLIPFQRFDFSTKVSQLISLAHF